MSLFTELKRRNVIRAAVAYAALAWLVVEVGSVVLPAFDAPEWVLRGLIIMVAAGLVPALILAWRYEFTPKGVISEAAASAAGTDSILRGRRADLAIIAVLGLALAMVIAERLTLDRRAGERSASGLAVLPFENLAPGGEDAHVAGGLHEELLSHLARLPELRVISRTSTLRVAQAGLTIPEIGKRLGVSHVLEGSLRRDEDRVRISVQLIDAIDDVHVWAEVFERKLDDLFALQSDVTLAIAAQLHRELSDKTIAEISEIPTTDPRAYNLYLRAIEELRSSPFGGSDEIIAGLLEQALTLDQNFLQAKVFLAGMLGRSEDPGSNERALQLVTEVQQRWPDHALARRALGHYRYSVQEDYAGALEAYQTVVAEMPNDIVSIVNIRNAYKRLDRRSDFLYWSRRAVELSPESQVLANEHVLALLANRELEETMKFLEASAERFDEEPHWKHELVANKLYLFGDVEAYLEAGEQMRAAGEWQNFDTLSWLYYARGDLDLALEHLAARRGEDYNFESAMADFDEAQILRQEGRDAEAQKLAERARVHLTSEVEAKTVGRDWWKELVLMAAQAAAVAGKPDEANRLRVLADERTNSFFWLEARADVKKAFLDAYLGDPEAGWQQFQPWADDPFVYATKAYLRVDPQVNLLFGDVPAFQEFVDAQDQN